MLKDAKAKTVLNKVALLPRAVNTTTHEDCRHLWHWSEPFCFVKFTWNDYKLSVLNFILFPTEHCQLCARMKYCTASTPLSPTTQIRDGSLVSKKWPLVKHRSRAWNTPQLPAAPSLPLADHVHKQLKSDNTTMQMVSIFAQTSSVFARWAAAVTSSRKPLACQKNWKNFFECNKIYPWITIKELNGLWWKV